MGKRDPVFQEALRIASAEGERLGVLKAQRSVVLRLLRRAGLAVSAEQRARLAACENEATLDRWVAGVLDGALQPPQVLGPAAKAPPAETKRP